MKITPPWVLWLDRTNWQIVRRVVNILMLAIAAWRLRIPLMWTDLNDASFSNRRESVALMRRELAPIGSGSTAYTKSR